MINEQIKIIHTNLKENQNHEFKVNSFISSDNIEVISIETHIVQPSNSVCEKRSMNYAPDLVTIISYTKDILKDQI